MGGENSHPSYNQEIANSKLKGFSSVYRKKGVTQLKSFPSPHLQTIGDVLRNTVKEYGKLRGIGEVKVEMVKDESNQLVQKRSIIEHSYQEVYDSAYNLGRSLYHRRLFFNELIHGMKLIGIHSKNRYEWFVADWACVLFGITTVPLYDTLGIENLTFCLRQTEMTTLFVTADTLPTLLNLKDRGGLQTVISFDPLKPEIVAQLKSLNLRLLYFSDLIAEGKSLHQINNSSIVVKPDDCYTFSYTSGTTGPPKGAMISHRNLLSNITSVKHHKDLFFTSQDIYFSYLPLPHLMERSLSLVFFERGSYLVISSGNILKFKEDCQVVKPSIFVSVPRIFNRIVESVKTKIAATEGVKGCLAQRALSSKVEAANEEGTYSSCLYDSLIFSKVKAEFGGNIRLMASGSAPLTPDTFSHMKAIMCCPLIEAYGQTQSSAGVLYSKACDNQYGVLTQISECVQLKLADIPEMKYTSEDRDSEGRPSPRGEILVRGPQVFLGYYKAREITSDTITLDGWLRTGDVGQIMPDSLGFRIIDRKKNIFKLQQGQYIAPDKVESVYLKSPLISEIFLHGDSKQNFAVAVAVPNKEKLMELTSSKGIKGSYEDLCGSKQVKILILSELNALAKREGLYGFQMAKNIELQHESFVVRKILTNTMKLIRYEARSYYSAKIEKMYQEGELSLPK